MDNLQIQVQAIIDEVKSLLGLQSSLQKMGEKLSLPVMAKLDKAKSRQQLKNDLATLDMLSVKLTGKLNKGDTRKAIKSDVKSLENEKIKLKATVDTKSIKKSLGSVKGASVDVDAKVDGAENVKKLEDGMDGINRVAPSAVGNVILLNKAISGLERAAREMVETAAELDEKLTDLRMVTGDSYDDAKALVDSYNDLAKELGATTAEVLDASSEWLRQGMSTEETAQLIEQSMILSKVGAMDAATATENLTSAMKGYGLAVSDVSSIVDKLTAIDLQAAVSSSDLAVGMSRTATSANIAGVSMDRLLGYLAVVQETTQKSAETIGESFKTIFARIGNVKLGNYIDENGEDLSDVETVLKHFGIALRDAQGDFRNTADVLDELYQKWNQFSGVDKRAVANAFAGTRQQENFLVLMENYGKALEYTEVAADSAGTALEKFGAYQESLQAKMNSFTAAFGSLSMNTLDADFLGTLIEAGTAMLQFADNTNLVKIALAGLSAAGVVKGFTALTGHIKNAYENVSKLSAAFNMLDNAADVGLTAKEFDALLSVTDGLNTSQLRLIVTNKALTNEQRMAILTASGLTTEEAAQTLATLGLTTAEATATTATFSLSGAFKALTAAIAANPIGFLVVALTTAVTIISSVADKVKQAQEEARQAALDAAEATKTEIEAINDLLSVYKDANEAYLSNTGSKKDLESATDALLAKLGVERSEINGLVEEYGNLDKALHGITADALKEKWSDLLSGLKASEDDLLAATENSWFSSYNVISGQGAKTAEILNRAGLISDGSYNENFAVYLGDNESIDGVLEMYDKLLAMDKALTDAVANGELSSDFLKDDDFYNLVKSKINDMKEYVEAYRQYVSDMNGIAAQIQIEEYLSSADAPASIEEYLALRNKMLEESSNNEMFYGDYQDRINAIDNYMQDAFSAIYDQYAANQAKIEAIANNMIPKNFEPLEEGTAAHFHAIDEYGIKIADLKAKLAGLSETDLDIAYNILSVPESGINSWEQLTAAIDEYKNGTGDIIAKSSAAKSILSTLWSSEDFEDTRKSIAEMANSIDGITAENIDELTNSSDELASVLEIDGMNAQFLAHILQVMAEGGDGVALLDAEGSIDGLTNSLTNLGLAASDGITVNVDAEALAPLLSELNFTKEQAENLITKLGEADGISLTNSQGEIKDTTDALEYLNGLDFATVTSNVDGVAQAVEDVDDETTDNVVDQFNNIETAASDAETAVKRVQTAVQHLDGQTATVTIDTKRKSGILGSIFGYASGTGAAPAGDALVGEEGAELIQSGDKAYLAGVNGAEVVNLKQGDRVYTADETKRIVHGSGKQLKGVIPAYAKGRVQTGGLHVETGKTGSTGTPITFDATVEVTIDDKKLEEQLKDKLDDLEDQLSDIIGNFEHSIFLLEKNDGTPEQIIAIYRKMQETVHAQAEKYRALGLDDTSDYIQDLQKKWWDYQDTIKDMLHDIYQTSVDNHNNMLSLLENQYDMLDNNQTKDAMLDNLYKQLEEQKKIQEEAHKEERRLRDLGLDENDEAIQDCINAWWGAYNDIQDINSKIADNVLDTFDDFIDYADDFDLWGDFNFTKVDYLKQKLKEINRLFEEGVLTLKEYNSLMRETGVEIYNEQKDALTKIIEMTMELVRQEAEDQVDALEAQIDAYKKIIELKKQSLQASFDEDSYQKEVAERVEKIAEVRAKLAQLERDTSASANAEKQKLAQELSELQNDLADYQANYSYEAQVDALDKEADTFEDTKNDEISYVKSTVDTEEKVYNAAIARINSNWEQLYVDLIEWNKQYGDMIDGEDSITSAWRTAKAAAQEYGDVVSALNGINSEISYAGKNADDKQTQIDSILSKMQTNSKGWHTAKTQEEKNRLVKENEDLAEQLSALLGRKVVKVNGVWYLDSANGPRLFHTGLEQGYVGGRSKGSDEVLAVLKAGELVMDKEQYMKVFNSLEYGGGVIDNLVRRLTGTSPAVSEVVKSITNDNSNTDNSSTDDRVTIQNYFQMQNVTEENMKGFAEYYADFTIGKLISANRRKGIRNKVANSMLRG